MLDISPTMTRLAGTVTSPSGTSSAPILEVKQTNTMVRVKDNEVVVLGGLIQEETTDSSRSIPGLGEIPGVGKAFGSTYNGTVRKELVIFLVPSILPDDPR
jgi:type II secretory pathway component GspD/PulD (secretin)